MLDMTNRMKGPIDNINMKERGIMERIYICVYMHCKKVIK